MKVRLGASGASSSRGLSASCCSSCTVVASGSFSPGLPGAEAGATMQPRAPGFLVGVTSASCSTEPSSVGRPSLALADRPGSGVEQREEAILDRLAGQTLADLRDHLLAALRQRLQALRAREDRGAASTELLPPSSGYELATTFMRGK